jgi:oxygen-independent coproporphyrinogen-3 oxidase
MVASGQVVGTDDDDLADKYLLANQRLEAAGQHWYEVSNWATEPGQRCRHNLGYWHSEDWWGVGPGAHSHLAGERWWNVKHPTAYAQRVMAGASPRAEGERLSAADQHLEAVMLQVRLAEGLPLSVLLPAGAHEASALAAEGLLRLDLPSPGRAQLTERGRLLADLVVRRILAAEESGASSATAR